MINVRVPGTSANLGSGFDSLGLSLNIYNTVSFEESDEINISSADGSFVPRDESNLVYRTAKRLYDKCGKPFTGLKLVQTNSLPMARGLGSSSACIVAGIMGANALMGSPLSSADILDYAVELEGHPDNVAPALLGGFVSCVVQNGHAYAIRHDVSQELSFMAFIPNFRLLTERARAALPEEVTLHNAIYNVSRAALCSAAFCEQRYDLLGIATGDMLHQQYRLPLIEGGDEVLKICRELGAKAAFISGAGPTLMAVIDKSDVNFITKARACLYGSETGCAFEICELLADNEGAKFI